MEDQNLPLPNKSSILEDQNPRQPKKSSKNLTATETDRCGLNSWCIRRKSASYLNCYLEDEKVVSKVGAAFANSAPKNATLNHIGTVFGSTQETFCGSLLSWTSPGFTTIRPRQNENQNNGQARITNTEKAKSVPSAGKVHSHCFWDDKFLNF